MGDKAMLQEHKLKGKALENLGSKLMLGCASWIYEATPGERNWLNLNITCKKKVGIMLPYNYVRLIMKHRAL